MSLCGLLSHIGVSDKNLGDDFFTFFLFSRRKWEIYSLSTGGWDAFICTSLSLFTVNTWLTVLQGAGLMPIQAKTQLRMQLRCMVREGQLL